MQNSGDEIKNIQSLLLDTTEASDSASYLSPCAWIDAGGKLTTVGHHHLHVAYKFLK
jgi:hypothetical protein